MDVIYKNIEECNPNTKPKILIVFDNVITDTLWNKKLKPTVTESFIACMWKTKYSSCFYYAILFCCAKIC